MNTKNPPPRPTLLHAGIVLAQLALGVALVSAGAALLAGPGYRLQWLSLGTGFLVIRWATYGAIGVVVAALLAWVVLALNRSARGRTMATIALLLGLLVGAPPIVLFNRAQHLPKIHDISTDTVDPPVFVDVLPLRQGARNPVDYKAETAAEQKRGFPDIAPARLALPPAQAFERAERAARSMGWQIVADKPEALRIEATDTTLMFGFKDDIVIRVRAQGQGSVVDVRSLSRIGGSDFGTNARRVRAFLDKLAAG